MNRFIETIANSLRKGFLVSSKWALANTIKTRTGLMMYCVLDKRDKTGGINKYPSADIAASLWDRINMHEIDKINYPSDKNKRMRAV